MTRVFVYGTLKRGGSNHGFLAGQRFIDEARTQPGFTLYALDGYPGLARDATDTEGVTGELWDADDACLQRLDALEGTEEGLYLRFTLTLAPPHDGTPAASYLYPRGVDGRPRIGPTWPV